MSSGGYEGLSVMEGIGEGLFVMGRDRQGCIEGYERTGGDTRGDEIFRRTLRWVESVDRGRAIPPWRRAEDGGRGTWRSE